MGEPNVGLEALTVSSHLDGDRLQPLHRSPPGKATLMFSICLIGGVQLGDGACRPPPLHPSLQRCHLNCLAHPDKELVKPP